MPLETRPPPDQLLRLLFDIIKIQTLLLSAGFTSQLHQFLKWCLHSMRCLLFEASTHVPGPEVGFVSADASLPAYVTSCMLNCSTGDNDNGTILHSCLRSNTRSAKKLILILLHEGACPLIAILHLNEKASNNALAQLVLITLASTQYCKQFVCPLFGMRRMLRTVSLAGNRRPATAGAAPSTEG